MTTRYKFWGLRVWANRSALRPGEVEFIGSTIVSHSGLASVHVDGRGGAGFLRTSSRDGPTTPTTLVGSGSSELILWGSAWATMIISIADGVIDLDGPFGVGRVAYSGLGSIMIEADRGGTDLITYRAIRRGWRCR